MLPRVVAPLQPWAEISERLRRYLGPKLANAFGVSRTQAIKVLAQQDSHVHCKE